MNDIADVEEELQEKTVEKTKAQEAGQHAHKTEQRARSSHKTKLSIGSVVEADPLVDNNCLENDETDAVEIISSLNKASLGPGMILKNTREEMKLTQEDVAKELRLAVRHIEYLEQDYFEKFTALAFYIGYVRNYSKLLELDADKMVSKFYAVYKVKPERTNNKLVKIVSWKDSWPMKLLFGESTSLNEKGKNIKYALLVASVALLCSIIWWAISSSTAEQSDGLSISKLELENMEPSRVDELVPTGPVIVKNEYERASDIHTAADDSKFNKISRLDSLS